ASLHTPERPPRGSDRLLRSLRGEVLLELVLLDLVGGRARDVRDDADVRWSHELGHLLLREPVQVVLRRPGALDEDHVRDDIVLAALAAAPAEDRPHLHVRLAADKVLALARPAILALHA